LGAELEEFCRYFVSYVSSWVFPSVTRHQSSILQFRAGPRSANPLTRSILLPVSDLTTMDPSWEALV